MKKKHTPYLDRDKIDKVYEGCEAIATEILGTNDEGRSLIDITLVDRTRYEHSYWYPVPYNHCVETPEEQAQLVEAVMGNLSLASKRLETFFQCLKYLPETDLDKLPHGGAQSATDHSLSAENAILVKRNNELEAKEDKALREAAIAIRTNEVVKSAREQRERYSDTLDDIEDALKGSKGVLAANIRKIFSDVVAARKERLAAYKKAHNIET